MAGAARAGMQIALLGARVAALAAARWRECRPCPAPARRRWDRAARRPPCRRRSSGSSRAPGPTRRRRCRRRGSARPLAFSSPARRMSSFQKVLPPSMMRVAGREQPRQLGDRRFRRRARRQHDPHGARRVERRDQLGTARRGRRPLGRQRRGPAPDRGRAPRRRGRPASAGARCWRPCGQGRSCRSAWGTSWGFAPRAGAVRG